MAENVVGDMVFYSPELASYIKEDPRVQREDLTTKSDIFALGLLYSLYLTGKLPSFDMATHKYAWMAVHRGHELELHDEPNDEIPAALVDLLNHMLNPEFGARPEIDDVFEELSFLIR